MPSVSKVYATRYILTTFPTLSPDLIYIEPVCTIHELLTTDRAIGENSRIHCKGKEKSSVTTGSIGKLSLYVNTLIF